MGYQTTYTLESTSDDNVDLHKQAIADASTFFAHSRKWPEESCSWYLHEDEMRDYSRDHPGVTFVLDGDGEEPGDIWRKWFRDGEMRVWRLEVDRPDDPPEPFQ